MEDSPEYAAIIDCGRELQEVIGRSYLSLTPSLLSKKLISRDTEERTRLNSTGSDIASHLLSDIRSSIRRKSTCFQEFIEILREDSYCDDVRDMLLEKLSLIRRKKDKSLVSLGGSVESDRSVSRSEGDDSVFDSINSVTIPMDYASSTTNMAVQSERMSIEEMTLCVAGHIGNVHKLRSLAILMDMSESDWDYVRTAGPWGKKRERLAELWVKKHREESLRLLVDILTQPCIAEQRIAQQISRGFSEDSRMSRTESISSVEMDGPTLDIQRKARYSKRDALNHLAVYPAQWEEIGKNLISPSEVDKIMNDQEARGDEAAYIIEKWWSITTEEDGNFSWDRLEDAIVEKVSENKSSHGRTILQCAAKYGHVNIVESILERGAELDHRDKNSYTALTIALRCGKNDVVDILIWNKPNLDIQDKDSEPALDIAIRNGHEQIVSLLEPHFSHIRSQMEGLEEEKETLPEGESSNKEGEQKIGDDNDSGDPTSAKQKPLHILAKVFCSLRRTDDYKFVDAAEKGDIKTLRHFLEDKHHDPNTLKPDMQSWTALMWACRSGHVDVVKLLLQHGASPNKVAKNGFSSLIIASKEGHYEVVRTLLANEEKPDIDAFHQGGEWTALMWACQKKGWKGYTDAQLKENHFKIAKALIDAGADINREAKNGWTPLMQASQDDNIEIVKMLCRLQGIKINHKSHSTWSALTTACRKEREDVARILVDAGADVTLPKKGGVTALHIACYKGLINTMKHMVPPLSWKNGSRVNVNVKDEWGMTPLMLAIKGGHKELTRYLVVTVTAELNIQAMKYNQWTAIFFAIRNKDLDTYHLLVDNGANKDIADEFSNTYMNVAGIGFPGLQKNKFYKRLKEEKKRLGEMQARETIQPAQRTTAQDLLDTFRLRYYPKDRLWKAQQQPHLIFNRR